MSNRCLSCMNTVETPVCPHCGYPERNPNEPHQLQVGTVLRDRYQVGKVLGQGGFGITYLAWDTLLNQSIAIKEYFPSGMVQRNALVSTQVECIYARAAQTYERSTERFLREARALVQFRDIPEVVDIQDFVKENNTAYIVMEYVRGMNLASYVQGKGGRLDAEETFRILRPVMEALAKVHKGGIVHRDISPDNIILNPLGGAKLLDFGAVRAVEDPDAEKALTKSTEAILKHGFAPIEQYNSRGSLGPWTDEYAMCATVWYCLSGRVPDDASIRMAEGIDLEWDRIPGLTERQKQALNKGIACRPKDRYPDLDAFLADLFEEGSAAPAAAARPSVQNPQQEAPPPVKQLPAEKPVKVRKQRKKWPLVAALLALVVAGAVVLGIPAAQKNQAEMRRQADYLQAEQLMEQGSYAEAIACFENLGDYADSADLAVQCGYLQAQELMQSGAYYDAAAAFSALGGYSDSEEKTRECFYLWAEELMEAGKYREAADLFESLGDYKDSRENLALCGLNMDYEQALSLKDAGEYYQAAVLFYSLEDFRDARSLCFACWDEIADRETVVFSAYSAVGVRKDGTPIHLIPQTNLQGWRDLIAVALAYHTVWGLRADGTVLVAGSDDYFGQCEVSDWRDIVSIEHDGGRLVGLKADGTVVATGNENYTERYGESEITTWTDIVDIELTGYFAVGLKADGTVLVELNNYGLQYCSHYGLEEVAGWTDIAAISVGSGCGIVGIRTDGTLVATREIEDYASREELASWRDVVSVAFNWDDILAVTADGTVLHAGKTDAYGEVSTWTDIVSVSLGNHHAVGLRSDGTAVAAGRNSDSQCEVQNWTDLAAVFTVDTTTDATTVGVKNDGTVVLAGSANDGRWKFATLTELYIPQ